MIIYSWKINPTAVFLFLLMILSSVCFRSRIKEWFKWSSQRFLRSTCQESWRTTAAGNMQHCREKWKNTTSPKLSLVCETHVTNYQEPHQLLSDKSDWRLHHRTVFYWTESLQLRIWQKLLIILLNISNCFSRRLILMKTGRFMTHVLHIRPHFPFLSDKQLTGSVLQSMFLL